MRLSPLVPLALFPLVLAGQVPAPAPAVPAPAVAVQAPAAPKPRARLLTSYGPVVLELEPALAPLTVANFLKYVEAGHYTGTIFHRVIDGFMVQGGGHLEDLTEKPVGAPVRNESIAAQAGGLRNQRGTVAMARLEDPGSATAQFYINLADNASLDAKGSTPGYTPFGHVVEGMEAVDKIAKVHTVWKRGMQNVPEYAVRIRKAEVLPPAPAPAPAAPAAVKE